MKRKICSVTLKLRLTYFYCSRSKNLLWAAAVYTMGKNHFWSRFFILSQDISVFQFVWFSRVGAFCMFNLSLLAVLYCDWLNVSNTDALNEHGFLDKWFLNFHIFFDQSEFYGKTTIIINQTNNQTIEMVKNLVKFRMVLNFFCFLRKQMVNS